MATELTQALTWTFISECPIPGDINNMLVDGENAVAAYKTMRALQYLLTNDSSLKMRKD